MQEHLRLALFSCNAPDEADQHPNQSCAALQQRQRDVQCFCWAIVTSLRFNAWLSALDTLWLLQNHEWISGDWQVFSAYPLMSDGQALQVGVQRTSYHCQLEASAIACLSIIEWRLGDVSALYVLCE